MDERTTIPEHVKQELRSEVGYGCPICRSPFLTWHHFDPPYRVRPHNNPKGMIALCAEHHDEADSDNWPPERLHALKKTLRSAADVKGSFPSWEHENILVRLGGNYFGGCEALFEIDGRPLVRLRKNDAGLLSLSFGLSDRDDNPLLRMIDNALELYPTDVCRFIATAKKHELRLWLDDRDIGLHLSFRRTSIEELMKLLAADYKRCEQKIFTLLEKATASGDDRLRDFYLEASKPRVPTWIDTVDLEIREQVRRAYQTGGQTGAFVTAWVLKNCVQSDEKIPFLNFKNLSFFFSGERLRIRNGLASGGLQIEYCGFFDRARRAINLRAPQPTSR